MMTCMEHTTSQPKREPLLSIEQTAEYVGVTPYAVRRWINDGELRCVRVNRRVVRIAPDHLRDFIDARTTGSEEVSRG